MNQIKKRNIIITISAVSIIIALCLHHDNLTIAQSNLPYKLSPQALSWALGTNYQSLRLCDITDQLNSLHHYNLTGSEPLASVLQLVEQDYDNTVEVD